MCDRSQLDIQCCLCVAGQGFYVHVQYRDRAHRRAGILRARTGCSCVYRGVGSQRRHPVPLCMSRGRGPTWILHACTRGRSWQGLYVHVEALMILALYLCNILHACRGVRTVMLRSQSRGAIEGGRGVCEQGFHSGET